MSHSLIPVVGTSASSSDAQVDEQLGDGFGGHRGAPIGMQGEPVAGGALPGEPRLAARSAASKRVQGRIP